MPLQSPDLRQGKPSSLRVHFLSVKKKGGMDSSCAYLGIRRKSGCETTLQSDNTSLGYQGLLVSGQGGFREENGNRIGEGSICAVSSCPFLGFGTLDLANPKGLVLKVLKGVGEKNRIEN